MLNYIYLEQKDVNFYVFIQVLGYGGMRGKLFVKHPDLFRYSVDLEDKDWLIRHKLHYMSQNSSGSSYILILDDIRELLNMECYRYFSSQSECAFMSSGKIVFFSSFFLPKEITQMF